MHHIVPALHRRILDRALNLLNDLDLRLSRLVNTLGLLRTTTFTADLVERKQCFEDRFEEFQRSRFAGNTRLCTFSMVGTCVALVASMSTILSIGWNCGSYAVPCTAGVGGGGGSLATLPRGLISALGVQVHLRAFSLDHHRRSWSWQDSLHPSISFAWPQTRPPVRHSSLDRLVHFFHSRSRLGTTAVDLGGQR